MIRNIAVQIAGEIRPGWNEIYDMWFHINQNKPDKYSIDFFLASWNTDLYKPSSTLFKKVSLDTATIKYESGIQYYYNRWEKVNRLRRYHEDRFNTSYDFVILIRPDLYIQSFWKWIDSVNELIKDNPTQSFLNPNILFTNNAFSIHRNKPVGADEYIDYHYIDDKFFAGIPSSMNYLTGIGNELIRGTKYQTNYHVSLAEYLLDGRIVLEITNHSLVGMQRKFKGYEDFISRKGLL